MYIASILIVTIFVNLNFSAAQSDLDLPSLCCITGDRRSYRINTTFITPDCKEQCVCTRDAFLACIPFCPQPIKDCPPHLMKEEINQSITTDVQEIGQSVTTKSLTCTCKKYKCVPPPGQSSMLNHCTVGNKLYKEGETFVRNCKEKCRCGMNGQVDCVPLCPTFKPCMVDHTMKKVPVPIPFTNKCQCSAQACKPLPVKDYCVVNNKKYKSGDIFYSSDCESKCSCHPGGKIMCETLCKPQGNNCKMDEEAVPELQPVKFPKTTCTCPSYKCVKNKRMISVKGHILDGKTSVKQPEHSSYQKCKASSGKLYSVGSVFSDSNCTQECHCLDEENSGTPVLSCRPLCPHSDDSCKRTVPTNIPDAEGITCICLQCARLGNSGHGNEVTVAVLYTSILLSLLFFTIV